MALSLFRKTSPASPIALVYSAIVAQSRQPRFYADWGVPDTVTGRFDMISLHLALLFRRLRMEEAATKAFSQQVFDLFFRDMDRSLRELGASDLAVPKKIKTMGKIFYGLLASLDTALASNDCELVADVLVRNVYPDAPTAQTRLHALSLARYVIDESRLLASQPASAIRGGTIALEAAA